MKKQDIQELTSLKNVMERLLALYKLTHLDEIKEAKKQVLSNKTRNKVYRLCDAKKGVTEIARVLKLSQPAITHHLQELYDLGLVSYETRGGKKYFLKII